ncbi:hypothetical protein CHN56_00398 [Bacillus velezensis]|nr:hypothetical protein CHN56_00398 [Bacillus velezensis]ATC53073.1 hypothetical protein CLI97_03849 [Bacillus velezensis]MCW5193931.1 hypothetical protein [Bacillus amyloliquefaciens]
MCGLKAFTDSNTMSRMQIGERPFLMAKKFLDIKIVN